MSSNEGTIGASSLVPAGSGALPPALGVGDYLALATRENTRRSYEAAVRHFEVEWGGLLPATTDSIARYLATYGAKLSASTLQQRLSALARWHADQGFTDPTRHPMVRQVLRGIRAAQPVAAKQAKPLQIARLQQVDSHLRIVIESANHPAQRLRGLRDRCLLLLGFWRGFRGDELVHLLVENIHVTPGEGLVCHLSQSKTDRQLHGRSFSVPALSRLCPVTAYSDWLAAAGIDQGPAFRSIDRWGRLSDEALHVDSLAPMLRSMFRQAGLSDAEGYSTHSFRRGFANWAVDNGWELKTLMEYVGWRDVKTALRYIEASPAAARTRIEDGLTRIPIPTTAILVNALTNEKASPPAPDFRVELKMDLSARNGSASKVATARRRIEQWCLEGYRMRRLDREGLRYEIALPTQGEAVDDAIYRLLDEMHRIAEDRRCVLDARFRHVESDRYWS